MSTETVGLLGTGAQHGHLHFHTAPEQSRTDHSVSLEAKRDAMHTYQKRDTVYYTRDAM